MSAPRNSFISAARSVCLRVLLLAMGVIGLSSGALADPAVGREAPNAAPMPELLTYNNDPEPLFVAATRVLLPDGTIDPSLRHPSSADVIAKVLSLPKTASGCVLLDAVGSSSSSPPPDRVDLRAGIAQSDYVFMGRVTGLEPGFRMFEAGTLVRVETDQFLKGHLSEQTSYVFMPLGDFQVGEVKLCCRQHQWTELPSLGDRMLVLAREGWYLENDDSRYFWTDQSSLLTISNGKVGRLPRIYWRSQPRLRELSEVEMLTVVRSLVDSEKRQ